jgi:hypothetical protein
MFEKCFNNIREVAEIEAQVLGSSIRINHPIFQLAWLQSGLNDLNNSSMTVNQMQDALFVLLKEELQGEIKNKDYCEQLIKQLVERMDGSLSSEPDGILSIDEINSVLLTLEDTSESSDVLEMLGFSNKYKTSVCDNSNSFIDEEEEDIHQSNLFSCCVPKSKTYNSGSKQFFKIDDSSSQKLSSPSSDILLAEKQETLDCVIEWLEPFNKKEGACINHKSPRECPGFPNSYGSDFNNAKAVKVLFPPEFDDKFQQSQDLFMGVQLQIEATDQGWGGTKHAQIRYSINDSTKPIVAFSIDRNANVNGIYDCIIPASKVTSKDTIFVWLYCPAWNGWQCKIKNIRATILIASSCDDDKQDDLKIENTNENELSIEKENV